MKISEAEDFLNDFTLFCLTETRQKQQNKKLKDNTGCVTSMRNKDEKEGGGIMVLFKETFFKIEKQKCVINDVLFLSCKILNFSFKLIVTYFDTADYNKNVRIKDNITDLLDKFTNIPVILLGDFNGHLGFLGKQPLDRTGNLVLDIAEKYNMIILNGYPLCVGETTWSRGEQSSSIDFILCNQIMYEKFKEMHIDDEKIKFDLSDHHLIEASFEVNCQGNLKKKGKRINNLYENR